MDFVEKYDTEPLAAVSVVESFPADANDDVISNNLPHEPHLSSFFVNMQSVLQKYSETFSEYSNHIASVLERLDHVDQRICSKKKSFRKRMRSAVDTSTELRYYFVTILLFNCMLTVLNYILQREDSKDCRERSTGRRGG